MTAYQAGAPMERVHLDFLGSLPKTKQGNDNVLMMVDQFTKYSGIQILKSRKTFFCIPFCICIVFVKMLIVMYM